MDCEVKYEVDGVIRTKRVARRSGYKMSSKEDYGKAKRIQETIERLVSARKQNN